MKPQTMGTAEQAIALGTLAGMRSMSAPNFLARHAAEHKGRFENSPARWIISEQAQIALPMLALGEMVFDKLPFVPKRKALGPLLGRIGSGGLVGASLFASKKDSPARGAALGAGSAAVSTFVSYYIRMFLIRGLKLPNVVSGLVEDAIILTVGPRILGTSKK